MLKILQNIPYGFRILVWTTFGDYTATSSCVISMHLKDMHDHFSKFQDSNTYGFGTT